MKKYFSKIYLLIKNFFNIDIVLILKSIINLPKFFLDLYNWKKIDKNNWPIEIIPRLNDFQSDASDLGEYFFQDLFVAKKILKKNPEKHIDVGSRIDGFIAHLACFREVEVFDIRDLQLKIKNIKFSKQDITEKNHKFTNCTDSASCLHTLEHIGLGRYGDQINPDGWRIGLENLSMFLKKSGILWLSVPIGIQNIKFNSHRIFDPNTIVMEAKKYALNLEEFYYYYPLSNEVMQSHDIQNDFIKISKQKYCLGIYNFKKN
tara:strand:- start:344 stop:1126 length:783 start_codon:yes stop_codon:yes gene_type:complete